MSMIRVRPRFAAYDMGENEARPARQTVTPREHELRVGERCVDVSDPKAAAVRWRAERDKIGLEHTVPLSVEPATALGPARRRAARIGDGYVFTSPGDDSKNDTPLVDIAHQFAERRSKTARRLREQIATFTEAAVTAGRRALLS